MKVYLCDPKKNTGCEKTFCQDFCKHTTQKEYRANLLKRVLYGVSKVIKRVNTRKENMDA